MTLSLASQTLALNGPLTILPSGSFTVDSGTLTGNSNAVLSGTMAWTAGALGGTLTIATNATVTVAGNFSTGNAMPACTLTNYGTVAWASGTILGGNGTTIYNYGLWDAQSDQTFSNSFGGAITFNNFGIFRKSVGSTE